MSKTDENPKLTVISCAVDHLTGEIRVTTTLDNGRVYETTDLADLPTLINVRNCVEDLISKEEKARSDHEKLLAEIHADMEKFQNG